MFRCHICGIWFNRRENLENHVCFVSSNAVEDSCHECGLKFASKRALNRHERSHQSTSRAAERLKSVNIPKEETVLQTIEEEATPEASTVNSLATTDAALADMELLNIEDMEIITVGFEETRTRVPREKRIQSTSPNVVPAKRLLLNLSVDESPINIDSSTQMVFEEMDISVPCEIRRSSTSLNLAAENITIDSD